MNTEYLILPANHPALNTADLIAAQEQSESYFHTAADDAQIANNEQSRRWVAANTPECWRIIKFGAEIIGHSYVLPCSVSLMRRFVDAAINERELLAEAAAHPVDYACLYGGSFFVAPQHRGKGLARRAALETLEYVINHHNPNPALFYWEYSPAGRVLASKLLQVMQQSGWGFAVHVRRTSS